MLNVNRTWENEGRSDPLSLPIAGLLRLLTHSEDLALHEIRLSLPLLVPAEWRRPLAGVIANPIPLLLWPPSFCWRRYSFWG